MKGSDRLDYKLIESFNQLVVELDYKLIETQCRRLHAVLREGVAITLHADQYRALQLLIETIGPRYGFEPARGGGLAFCGRPLRELQS